MKLINYDEYNSLRGELNEFVVLCKKYNYTPSKNDFDDIIRFILLQSGSGSTTLCESYEINPFKLLSHLYESYEFNESDFINEGDGGKDFDSATGTVTTGVKAAAAGAVRVACRQRGHPKGNRPLRLRADGRRRSNGSTVP